MKVQLTKLIAEKPKIVIDPDVAELKKRLGVPPEGLITDGALVCQIVSINKADMTAKIAVVGVIGAVFINPDDMPHWQHMFTRDIPLEALLGNYDASVLFREKDAIAPEGLNPKTTIII